MLVPEKTVTVGGEELKLRATIGAFMRVEDVLGVSLLARTPEDREKLAERFSALKFGELLDLLVAFADVPADERDGLRDKLAEGLAPTELVPLTEAFGELLREGFGSEDAATAPFGEPRE